MKKHSERSRKMIWCEVVRVDSPLFLINSSNHACRYESAGEPLASGNYLALWPAGACRTAYGSELRYLGPFATPSVARLLHTSATALGLVDLVDQVDLSSAGERAIVAKPAAAPGWQPAIAGTRAARARTFAGHLLPA